MGLELNGPHAKDPKWEPWEEIAMRIRNPKTQNGHSTTPPEGPTPPTRQKKRRSHRTVLVGLTYGLFSGFFFSATAACVKYLDELDPGLIALYQYIAITVFALPMVIRSKDQPFGRTLNEKGWFLLSGFFDALTVYLAFVSFKYLSLADASAMTSSVPVFVSIAARIFLGERCGAVQLLAIVVSVFGVALVSKVPLLIANRSSYSYSHETVIGLAAAVGSIATESGVYVALRRLHHVNVYIILFNFGIVATIVNALLTVIFGEFSFTACGLQQAVVIGIGVFSFLCQLTLTKALEIEDAGPVSVLMAAGDIILSFLFDMILFKDTPDAFTIGGTGLVIVSVILIGSKNFLQTNRWMPEKLMKISL